MRGCRKGVERRGRREAKERGLNTNRAEVLPTAIMIWERARIQAVNSWTRNRFVQTIHNDESDPSAALLLESFTEYAFCPSVPVVVQDLSSQISRRDSTNEDNNQQSPITHQQNSMKHTTDSLDISNTRGSFFLATTDMVHAIYRFSRCC